MSIILHKLSFLSSTMTITSTLAAKQGGRPARTTAWGGGRRIFRTTSEDSWRSFYCVWRGIPQDPLRRWVAYDILRGMCVLGAGPGWNALALSRRLSCSARASGSAVGRILHRSLYFETFVILRLLSFEILILGKVLRISTFPFYKFEFLSLFF